MEHRKDALVAASVFVQAVADYAESQPGLVATVGQLTVQPGAANVVPGEVTLSLDVRHADDAVRLRASKVLVDIAGKIAHTRGIAVTTNQVSENGRVQCSQHLTSMLAQAEGALGQEGAHLAGGAGHAAVERAGVTDVAMLSVR